MLQTSSEKIGQELEQRLLEILVGNGYAFDVAEVVRPTRRGENWQQRHQSIAVLQDTSERVPELDCPGNPPSICYATTFQLVGICRDSVSETDPRVVNDGSIAAAIIRAITVPASIWHTFGGVAINAEIGNTEPATTGDGEINGVVIPIRVIYRVSENDPYTVRA